MKKNKKKFDPALMKKARDMMLSKKLKREWCECGSDGDTTFADDNQC